jgi:glucose-1-phosphate cytidylyltransferase
MKVVILAGGLGTRLSEETVLKPKPMVEIGGKPILWHIMKIYSHYGFNDFIICLGYKGYMIKEYFANYTLHNSDMIINFKGYIAPISPILENWKISLIDTGENTMTGGRLKRIQKYLDPNETFMATYGDGLADINLKKLLDSHYTSNRIGTVTAVKPPIRYGILKIKGKNNVTSFAEKPKGEGPYASGGFFVFEPKIFNYLDNDETVLEHGPLERLALLGQMNAYKHNKFWYAMDTAKDRDFLGKLWADRQAPWRVWE